MSTRTWILVLLGAALIVAAAVMMRSQGVSVIRVIHGR